MVIVTLGILVVLCIVDQMERLEARFGRRYVLAVLLVASVVGGGSTTAKAGDGGTTASGRNVGIRPHRCREKR